MRNLFTLLVGAMILALSATASFAQTADTTTVQTNTVKSAVKGKAKGKAHKKQNKNKKAADTEVKAK